MWWWQEWGCGRIRRTHWRCRCRVRPRSHTLQLCIVLTHFTTAIHSEHRELFSGQSVGRHIVGSRLNTQRSVGIERKRIGRLKSVGRRRRTD
jgi:hypothetical protein